MSMVYLDCCDTYRDLDRDNEVVIFQGKQSYQTSWRCHECAVKYLEEKHGITDETKIEEILDKGEFDETKA